MSGARARSGKDVDELTLDGVLAGEVGIDDIRIHPQTLLAQAEVATANGNPQLGANLRRAAELTALSDERVLAIYEALRPHRSTHDQLTGIADELQATGAATTAALVRHAAQVYRGRGLLR
jgi:propanediol dehydratase small subunit